MGIVWSRKTTILAATILFIIVLGVSLFFALQKPVTIAVDGKVIKSGVFFTSTVGGVLDNEAIAVGKHDRVQPSLNSKVKKNTRIVVTRAFQVKIIADGKSKELITTPISVKEAIRLAGFKLGEKDIVKTIPVPKTVPDQEIEVIRVTESEVSVEEPIPCGVERTSDNSLERGLTKTIIAGKDGLAKNTVKITYHNGEEVKREVINSETLVEPKNRVIAMGTITAVSRGNQMMNFREARYMEASAYTYTGNRTATGKNPEVGMVAVDPRVIPMGSRLYIEGYGYGRAADTGGSIKGNRLDLFMEDRSQCLSWGRRTVKVYLLD
jgi:uncharacterized protein YabE (DUF348 family)